MVARTALMISSALILTFGIAPAAHAEAIGYGVAGPGWLSGFFSSGNFFQVGAGGELAASPRVALGGEVGILGDLGSILLIASANGVYRLTDRDARIVPFVSGGYTRMNSGEGSFNAFNVGAGFDYWRRPRFGIRIEARDQVRPDSRGTVQYFTVRAGLVLRTN